MSIIPKLWAQRIVGGTEGFWIPAVLAAASAGTQYVNTQNANSKQQAGEVQTILDQQKLQQQANGGVKALTQSIANDSPNTLANQATGAYVSQLRKNAAGTQTGSGNNSSILFGAPTSSLPTNIKGSSRYGADTAASQGQVQSFGNQLAGEMGQIDAATRQRQNEGLAAGTLATTLNGLGAQSYTQNFVDQLRANTAGQASPWLTLLSGALGGAGNTLSKNMAPSATPSAGAAFTGDGSINGRYGLPGSTATMPQAPQLWDPTVPQ
jgi:hypothetical protein